MAADERTAARIRKTPIQCSGRAVHEARMDMTIFGHAVIIDEPPARKGTDLGPTPVDLFVAALAGCTNVILHKIAGERNVRITSLEIDLDAPLDPTAILGIAPIERPIETVRMTVRLATDAPSEQVAAMREALAWRCPVGVMLRQAGIVIEETWQVSHAG
jgi:putative redox protein